jgi:hypothetical protein
MPTDFDDDPRNKYDSRPKWTFLFVIALMVVAAVALANRQVDRTTGMAPDKGASEKTVGLSPQTPQK